MGVGSSWNIREDRGYEVWVWVDWISFNDRWKNSTILLTYSIGDQQSRGKGKGGLKKRRELSKMASTQYCSTVGSGQRNEIGKCL